MDFDMKIIVLLFKALRKIKGIILGCVFTPIAKVLFVLNGIKFGNDLHVNGLMKVFVTRRGIVKIGKHLTYKQR